MTKSIYIFITILFALPTFSVAQDMWSAARPDGHAPISVMGDHYHHRGEFMLSYRFMPMYMEGMLAGSDEISTTDVLQGYMVTPLEMQMNMHMIGAMYAVSDQITLMGMVNILGNEMDLRTRMGAEFTTESGGIGDVSLGAIIKLMNANRQSLHANVGISLPTGDIDQRDATPMADNVQLAYPMQLGSGTLDPSLGLTYLGQADMFSWGAQAKYLFRGGDNSEDYRFGNRLDAVAWGAIKAADFLSFSASLSYFDLGSIEGTDKDLNPLMMPLFDAANSGRNQMDMGIGANVYVPSGALENLRVGIEFKLPIAQEVTGIQMQNKWMGTLGLQYAFGH